jgi:hypothetical protein
MTASDDQDCIDEDMLAADVNPRFQGLFEPAESWNAQTQLLVA